MISGISTASAGSSNSALTRAARLAELNKQVSALQQQLTQNRDTKPEELAGLRANSISQDIATAKAQIEKAVLDSQLAKLSLVSDARGSENTRQSPESGDSAPDPNDPSKSIGESGSDPRAESSVRHMKSRKGHGRHNEDGPRTSATEAYVPGGTSQGTRLNVQA